MKKLLGILVLFLTFGCADYTVHQTEVTMWQSYTRLTEPYKAYAKILEWQGRYLFGTMYKADYVSIDDAIAWIYQSKFCSKGCIITHIGNNKINLERQKEIAKKWLPENIVKKYFEKPKKVVTTTSEQEPEKKVEASSGSAFFVSNTGYIITNFHVIETCNDNSKIFYKTNEIDAKLIAKDEYLDLALLKAEVSNNKFITISNKAPRKLQRIIAAGYPFGKYLSDDMKFTSGIVSSLKGLMDDSTRLQIDAALNPGNSGGPIVDENTGELVAVAVAGLRKDVTEAVNYGIKAGSVKNFLESNQIDPSTFSKKFSTGDIAKLLESTVLYTFCN